MSLRIWLPLTKDLRNQGLDNIIVTNNGATFNSVGKLGGCYLCQFTIPSSSIINNLITYLDSGGDFSVAFWFRYTTANTGEFVQCGDSSATGSRLHFVISNNVLKFGFRANDYDGPTLVTNTWYHVVCSYSNSKKYIYLNGNLHGTANSGKLAIPQNNAILFTSSSVYLNDFRIYDHCLSPMEVKELAKGLILHYPLNRQGWGQENQFKNSNFTNGTSFWYGVNSSSIRVETKDGYTCATGTKGTGNNIVGQTSASYTGGTVIDITVSAKVYVTETGTFSIGHWISTSQASGWQGMSGSTVWNTTNNLSVGWNYISVTRKNSTSQYTGNIVTAFGYTGTTFWITNVKLEFGDKATPWCPNSSDVLATTMGLNSTTEYDCSGFGNNGTRVGTFSWTSDTPKYQVSTEFNGTNATIDCGNAWHSQGSLELTFSAWVYVDDWGSGSANYYLSSQETGGIILQSLATSNNIRARIHAYTAADLSTYSYYQADCVYANTGISGSGWHMLTGVYTASSIKLYIDGTLKKTTSLTTYGIHFNNTAHMFLAAECAGTTYSNLCNCKLSDVRIYATALSANDVKSLYQNSAYIDSSGNIYGAVHEEV